MHFKDLHLRPFGSGEGRAFTLYTRKGERFKDATGTNVTDMLDAAFKKGQVGLPDCGSCEWADDHQNGTDPRKVEHAKWKLDLELAGAVSEFVIDPFSSIHGRGLDLGQDIQMAYSPSPFPCISDKLLEADFAAIQIGTPPSSDSCVSMRSDTPSFGVGCKATVCSGKKFNPNRATTMQDFKATNMTKKRIN